LRQVCVITLVFYLKAESRFSMPKLKTHKGAAKRFKKTGTGKIVRHKAGLRHILSSKAKKRKKQLGKATLVSDGDYKKAARMIPYM
jgi:large subunit ribosomal protein L35